ncbi:MAG TPA: glutamate formimidoyltransferase [Syntrophales bacterium]|nr:glutamate formimidoyltransferase [Syntrophales bacterium]
MKIIECVPNISEGRDNEKIDSIAAALSSVGGVKLLNVCIDADHNRTVLTFIGEPEDILRGAMAACEKALDLIDMSRHKGVHPRIGAVDVVPFVPLKGATMKEAVDLAHRFGRSLAEKRQIPVYFYGEAALGPARRELSALRRGEYEALKTRFDDPSWMPDAGPARFDPKSGAVACGAREPLIAYNINLATDDLQVAKDIACAIRQSSGGMKYVKALGLPLASRNIVQVSMNLTNYKVTSPQMVFDAVEEKARARSVDILESELVGLIPEEAMENVSPEHIKLTNFCTECIIETHLGEHNN